MLPLNQVHVDPQDVESRLSQLGLDEITLRTVVERGFAAWASCTPNHPPAFPGLSMWAETVRGLGDLLASRGWKRVNESNLPLVLNQDGKLALTVSTGDDATGQSDGNPCTNSAKGPKTASAISDNRQLFLFPEADPAVRRAISENVNAPDRSTWILLLHRDMDKFEVRSELSRPIAMSEDGRVDGWAERIILKPFRIDPSAGVMPIDDNPQSPEIDLDVRRRA